MEWCHINFWLLRKNRPKVTLSWSKLMIDYWDTFSCSIFWVGGAPCWRQQQKCRIFWRNERFTLHDEHTSLLMVYITHFIDRVLTYLLIVSFLCEWQQLQFRSPSCLLVVFPCLETLSRLCWAFSSFHRPPLCKSSSASSSGPRWGQHCHLRVFCYFVWNNGNVDPFTTILHIVSS